MRSNIFVLILALALVTVSLAACSNRASLGGGDDSVAPITSPLGGGGPGGGDNYF